MTLSNTIFGFISGIVTSCVIILSLCYSIGIIVSYGIFIFEPINTFFISVMKFIWKFFYDNFLSKIENNNGGCGGQTGGQTGGGKTHEKTPEKKPGSGSGSGSGTGTGTADPTLAADATILTAVGSTITSEAGGYFTGIACSVFSTVKIVIYYFIVIIAGIILLFILYFVIMFFLMIYSTIITGLLMLALLSYFLFVYKGLILLSSFYANSITGYFVTHRKELTDPTGAVIPNEYIYEGDQKFNLLICFYLTFLNKTLIYYSLFVAFFVLPLIVKYFGSISLIISLVVAFMCGYRVYNIKKDLISKMMSTSGIFNMSTSSKDDKQSIMSNSKAKALVVSAVAQEERKKKTKDS